MRHFGYKTFFLILVSFLVNGCICMADQCSTVYSEKDMGQLATLTRTTMDIVWSGYIGDTLPSNISEPQILETVRRLNTNFDELNMLDRYEMVMVSDGLNLATIVWDPENDRKLIEDLRCTKKLDASTWRECSFGNAFSLEWNVCH